MKHSISIAGCPGAIGGAATELAHNLCLLRRKDVSVELVPMSDVDSHTLWVCGLMGITVTPYHPGVFAGKCVAAWNNGSFLCHLPEIMDAGPPARVLWFNCMTVSHRVEKLCHHAGWLHVHGFLTDHQRQMLLPRLQKIRPVQQMEGYIPYFDRECPFQPLSPRGNCVPHRFHVGRLSRDDPAKYSADHWDIFSKLTAPGLRVRIMGWGPQCQAALGPPPPGDHYDLLPPGAMPTAEFLDGLDCMLFNAGAGGESFCRVVIEAFAAGIPAVAYRRFSLPELIDHGVTGFIADSADEMALYVDEIGEDRTLRDRLSYNARERFESEWGNVERCWAAWERFFQS